MTNTNVYLSNTSLGWIYFIYYASNILSRKYDCAGLYNICIVRCKLDADTNKLINIKSSKFFLDKYKDFLLYYTTDLSRAISNGLEAIKENLYNILLRSTERVSSC